MLNLPRHFSTVTKVQKNENSVLLGVLPNPWRKSLKVFMITNLESSGTKNCGHFILGQLLILGNIIKCYVELILTILALKIKVCFTNWLNLVLRVPLKKLNYFNQDFCSNFGEEGCIFVFSVFSMFEKVFFFNLKHKFAGPFLLRP